jgi:signal transduction histidine kinase
LQALLGFGVAVSVGAHALEWILEWTPAMPLRALWLVPIIMLWAVVMTLPLGRKATLAATLGVLAIAQTGIVLAVAPSLGAVSFVTTAFAYGLCGYGLVLFAHWRERDHRELFSHRHEHQELAAQLRAQYETLQQLISQRNEFVAGVLHDLRSPLTAVLLNTEMLRSGDTLPPAVRLSLLDDIARSAKRVDAFANRFLEQRSLERAAATPTLTSVLLGPVVERAVAHARLSAGPKNQRIEFVNASADQVVVADELLLDRALGNLLDNAVKYSPLGAAITVQLAADPGAPARARVSVSDAGPGLSGAEQARLFQPYTQLGKKPTGGEPSTGLGLSLVKHCIAGMGGEVGCESETGRGATFWLSLRHA